MAYRGSLRHLARIVFDVAKSYPNAIFYIVKHPAAKYYSLVDGPEFDKLTDAGNPQNVLPIFCGTQGELLSLIKCDLEQMELFTATDELTQIERDAHLNLGTTQPNQYDV